MLISFREYLATAYTAMRRCAGAIESARARGFIGQDASKTYADARAFVSDAYGKIWWLHFV